ncbi:MAG: LD-carboxypeptidase [Actinobacteria bacterium]|nr:LD-carboxypeptidase [Actinomycetota bacterium]
MRPSAATTFYGPALVSELGEHPQVLPYTDRWLRAAWLHSEPLAFEPAEEWTDEFLDWDEKRDLERPRTLHKGNGWVCIRPGRAEGSLLGGCLETIAWHVRGTDIWIDPGGAVLFLETSEESPSPAHVYGYLTTLERDGVLDLIAGLVIGRPYGYDEEAKKALFEVIARHTESAGIPVLADVDLGHTDPMLTLPLGATATLDAAGLRFSIER